MIRMVTVLLMFALGSSAQAQTPQVAVGRFRGPQGARIRAMLIQNLEDNGLQVVDRDEVDRISREVSRGSLQDDDYASVARELEVKAFITGRVARARRNWTLRVSVRNGADGMSLGNARWRGRTIASLRRIRRNGFEKLQELLSLASAPAPPAPMVVVAPEGEEPWYQRAQEDVVEQEQVEEPEPAQDDRWTALRIGATAGVLRRSMTADVFADPRFRTPFDPGAPVAETREYSSGGLGHFELGLRAELYPGVLLRDPVVPWLGLIVQYRHSVGLESQGPSCLPAQEPLGAEGRCPTAPSVPIETSQQQIDVGLRADINFGEDRRGPWLSLDLGWGKFSFDLDSRDLALLDRVFIVPSFNYSYVHLGVGARYGLHDLVALGIRAAYRLGLGVGADARDIWGGSASTSGFMVGVDLIHEMSYLAEGVTLTLSVEYFRFSTKFRRQSSCRDPDIAMTCDRFELWEPWPETDGVVVGGIPDPVDDNYLRLGLTVGYELR